MNFYSVEIIYYGAGSVIIWLRRFTGKSKNDIVQVLKRTLFDLSSYEVLEIYPYPELVQNDWFISTMRIFNNFMLGLDFQSYPRSPRLCAIKYLIYIGLSRDFLFYICFLESFAVPRYIYSWIQIWNPWRIFTANTNKRQAISSNCLFTRINWRPVEQNAEIDWNEIHSICALIIIFSFYCSQSLG